MTLSLTSVGFFGSLLFQVICDIQDEDAKRVKRRNSNKGKTRMVIAQLMVGKCICVLSAASPVRRFTVYRDMSG